MKIYLDLLKHVLTNGTKRTDRTGVGTIGIFGYNMAFDLRHGFPILTTKKVHFKSIKHELIWFLSGSTNIKYLKDNGITIWDEWADENGEVGKMYGYQWASQLDGVINEIKTNPHSRRLLVSAWNVSELKEMALPPCHIMFQFYVEGNTLSLQYYQRSADIFLGLPFNIASYALLLTHVAELTGLVPTHLKITLGDAHIYLNHLDQVNLQLQREPMALPMLEFTDLANAELVGYNYYPAIKAPIAI